MKLYVSVVIDFENVHNFIDCPLHKNSLFLNLEMLQKYSP